MTLTLRVSIPALVVNYNGERTLEECTQAVVAALAAPSMSDVEHSAGSTTDPTDIAAVYVKGTNTRVEDTAAVEIKARFWASLAQAFRVLDVVEGFKCGEACARALGVGNTFLGSMGHAEAAGLIVNTMKYRGFMIGFAGGLPETVVTTLEGVLVEYR
jgi:hypothetical protein